MSQGAFTASNSGASTTNYTNDTTFYFLGGAPFTGPPDWTQVINGPYTGLGTYTSDWIITGPGMASGIILSITFDNTGGNNSVIVILQTGGGAFISGGGNTFNPPAPCFLEGTVVLCIQDGKETYLPVETLRPGTLVATLSGVPKKIVAIGHTTIQNPGTTDRTEQRLYKCSPHKYPELKTDLFLTGGHSILVPAITQDQRTKITEYLGRIFVTEGQYRLPALVDERAEPLASSGTFTVWHFALEHDNVRMNYGVYVNGGLLVETCPIHYLNTRSNMTLKID
jgi:hypothetical protein